MPRPLADEDGAWIGDRLDTRGRVDEVTGNHALTGCAHGDRRLTGHDRGAGYKARLADLGVERLDGLDEVERGSHGALGVVLLGHRGAPHGHHGVADELLHRAAEAFDHLPSGVEVAGEQLPNLLGVPVFGERGEPDEVGEEDGNEPPLRGRRGAEGRRSPGLSGGELRSALVAEPLVWWVRRAAARAGGCERRAAFAAEACALAILGSAARADHTA